jgi:AraC-like DNA-binding protein
VISDRARRHLDSVPPQHLRSIHRLVGVGDDLRRRSSSAELSRAPHVNRSVQDIASAVGTSPFHLCRVFRAHTGRTMHEYRAELRVRLALEMLEASGRNTSLSRVAHDAGFSSHSHFVLAANRYGGATPSALRRSLAGGAEGVW